MLKKKNIINKSDWRLYGSITILIALLSCIFGFPFKLIESCSRNKTNTMINIILSEYDKSFCNLESEVSTALQKPTLSLQRDSITAFKSAISSATLTLDNNIENLLIKRKVAPPDISKIEWLKYEYSNYNKLIENNNLTIIKAEEVINNRNTVKIYTNQNIEDFENYYEELTRRLPEELTKLVGVWSAKNRLQSGEFIEAKMNLVKALEKEVNLKKTNLNRTIQDELLKIDEKQIDISKINWIKYEYRRYLYTTLKAEQLIQNAHANNEAARKNLE